MKTQTHPLVKAHLLRGVCYLLLLLALAVIPLGFGQRPMKAPSPKDIPTGFVCMGCPAGDTWRPGPDMPSTAVRTVGVYFWPNGNFYVMGGRSMDGVGNDFTHPFEFNGGTGWSIKSATYPDN